MHLFEALIRDHDKIKDLMEELINLSDKDTESRDDLIEDIRDELIPHSRAEESILYNSLRALDAHTDAVMHSFREHMEAEGYLRMLQVEEKINISWKPTAHKLKQSVEKHLKEEEDRIFAIAREVITPEEAQELGSLFEKIKPQIQDESFLKNSIQMIENLMPLRFSTALKKLRAS